MAKLKEYPQLKQYFEAHLTDGLYMLQFRKCTDRTCCIMRNDILPPPIPAPILSEDKQHYMKFEETYGKGKTTAKDCPSLQSKEGNKKSSSNHKYIASRVIDTTKCVLCAKERCIFSLDGKKDVNDERKLDNLIYS